MNHPTMTPGVGGERIVYIRPVAVAELPEEARAHIDGDAVYAIHDSNGNRLAFVADRKLAFTVARQNAMTPVSVH
jgi:hypothetical protein